MGEILGLGLTHYPLLGLKDESMTGILHRMLQNPNLPAELREPSGWPEEMRKEYGEDRGLTAAKKHRETLAAELRKLRKKLDEFNPDFVVVWGDDQYENFKEDIIPSFCLGIYDQVECQPWKPNSTTKYGTNFWDEPADKTFVFNGHQAGGKYLANGLLREGFDIAYAYKPAHYEGLPHAFLNAALFLDYDRKGFNYPMLPFQVNTYGRHVIAQKGGLPKFDRPPLTDAELDPIAPSSRRCMEIGAATARVLKDSPYRVALIASSSWSHAFLTSKNHYLYPDLETDRRYFNAMVSGDYEVWRNMKMEDIEASGQQEILNWSCLVGAMEELNLKPVSSKFVETYILNSSKSFIIAE